MRKLLSILIVSTFTLSGLTHVNACGDKTLRVGHGIRMYQALAAKHPSAILLYSADIASGKSPQLLDYLKKVGHKPRAVGDAAHLSEALKSGQYDIVLTELADAAKVQKQVESSTPRPVVVPVLFRRSRAEEVGAMRQYKVIVKNPTSLDDFLAAVQLVMKAKSNKS